MRNIHFYINLLAIAILIALGSCKDNKAEESEQMLIQEQPNIEIKGDSMLYGLSCDGTSDSVIVLWLFGGDPVTYNIIDAHREGRVIGKPAIGDWVGIMVNPEDTTEATMVINLDALKATWTYPVMPVMKDLQHMSKRMQRRMMENMPDSVRNTYFVPREYGFTLKRSHQAQAVGRVMRSSSLEDDSPVEYPEVKNYSQWYMYNGRLILVSGLRRMIATNAEKDKKQKPVLDTLDFVYMDEDSLILMKKGERIGFHKKASAMAANAAATKAQQKHDSKK